VSARLTSHLRNNIVGYVAVFIALSAGAYAAGLKKNSVKSKQIKDGAVVGVDVGDDSLTGQDIAEGTLDNALLQRRIGAGCSPGQAIRSIAADGSVSCEATDAGAPSGGAGGDLAGTYPNPQIAAGAVGAAEVADGSLSGADIDDATLFNDNSLTGGDIDESTLSGVNASTVGGAGACRSTAPITLVEFASAPVCTFGPFTITTECPTTTQPLTDSRLVISNTSANNSFYSDTNGNTDTDFDAGEQLGSSVAFDPAGAGATADSIGFHLAAPSGPQLAGIAGARAEGLGFLDATCTFSLVAFG